MVNPLQIHMCQGKVGSSSLLGMRKAKLMSLIMDDVGICAELTAIKRLN
jgi:hypothetical protein